MRRRRGGGSVIPRVARDERARGAPADRQHGGHLRTDPGDEPPPRPGLVDASGAPDENGLAALVGEVEERRGLHFVRHPTLDLVAGDDSRVRALAAADCALAPCSRQGACDEPATVAAGGCFPSADGAGIVCVAPPDLEAARRALRRLLDEQTYPRLARAAARARRRPRRRRPRAALGQRERAVAPAGGRGLSERLDLLDLDPLESAGGDDPASACTGMASTS